MRVYSTHLTKLLHYLMCSSSVADQNLVCAVLSLVYTCYALVLFNLLSSLWYKILHISLAINTQYMQTTKCDHPVTRLQIKTSFKEATLHLKRQKTHSMLTCNQYSHGCFQMVATFSEKFICKRVLCFSL